MTENENTHRKHAWLHVDTDGLDTIHEAHGTTYSSAANGFYTSALRNSLAFFERHGVLATYFIIAQDLDDPEKLHGLREIVAAGHRVASHSFTHPTLTTIDATRLHREIVDSRAKIEDTLGVPCKGFRAPGYSISLAALEKIADAGYQYDSSIFPNLHFRKRLGIDRLLPEPFLLFREPSLFEVPLPQGFPGLPPFHPCYAFYLRLPYFRKNLEAFHHRHDNFTLLFHFTDFAEREPGLASLSMQFFANNFFSAKAKQRFLDCMMETLRTRYRFMLVEDFLDAWASAAPGINPRTILGVSTTHETGACVVRDGTVLSAITEERITRKKFDAHFPPEHSIREAIRIAGIPPKSIDAVAIAGLRWPDLLSQSIASLKADIQQLDTWLDVIPHMFRIPYRVFSLLRAARYSTLADFLKREYGIAPKTYFIEHHLAHASSAYRTCKERDAVIVTADGVGDDICFTISEPRRGALIRRKEWYYPNSFGQFYSACTQLLGFKAGHHEGKITGLAAFGKLDPTLLAAVSSTLHAGEFRLNKRYYVEGLARGFIRAGLFEGRLDVSKLSHRNYKNALGRLLAGYPREDVARVFQHLLEEKTIESIGGTVTLQDRHVAVAGGVFANVKLNAAVFSRTGAASMWVFPAMGDGGLAVGAALELTAEFPCSMSHVYLGNNYSDGEIEAALHAEPRVTWTRPENMAGTAARLLADKQTMARYRGSMEFGPRALGNRSILYHCGAKEVNTWLNKQLERTEFMPFAPICLYEDADLYFVMKGGEKHAAEFMTIVTDCTARMKTECPAAVHVDGTARPQLVRREINPEVHALLSAYRALTGSSCLINTSFNMHEEPIVRTPSEAVKAYLQAGLDWLIAGPFLVTRRNHPRNAS